MSVVRVEHRPGGWAVTVNGMPISMFGRIYRDRDDAKAEARDLARRYHARLEIESENGEGALSTDKYCTTNGY